MLAVIADMSGPSLWRVLQPFTALQKRGYDAAWDFKDAAMIGEIAPHYDGYVLPRMAWQPGHRRLAESWFGMLRRAGKITVYDCDDDIFGTELERRAGLLGWDRGKSPERLASERDERLWAMRQCDGVTVSTPRLATVVRSLTDRPVVVVPNAIDVPWFRKVLRTTRRRLPSPTIGWAGGARPDDDLEAMAEAWGRIAARHLDVTFVVCGFVPPCLRAAVPAARLHVVPWLPLERYPVGLVDIDIACASVSNTPFNRAKSPIKAYEAAVAGAAVVVSPTVYGQLVEHGVTGMVAESADEWEHALEDLLARPARRAIMARRLLRHVERRCSLAENVWRWPAAWSAIREAAYGRVVVA